MDLERHYNQMTQPRYRHHPLNFSKLNINSFQSYPPGPGPGHALVKVHVKFQVQNKLKIEVSES